MNGPCPAGYWVSSLAELFTERMSWGSGNAAGAILSPLKWPLPGIRSSFDGLLYLEGTEGRYWSGTVGELESQYLYLDNVSAYIHSRSRAEGYTVRCIKYPEP